MMRVLMAINITPRGWSDYGDVIIGNMDYVDEYGYTTSMATYVFHYTGYLGDSDYEGYVYFNFSVDEWGNIDYWLE